MTIDIPSLPFGKYLDPNTLGRLKTVGYIEIDEGEPEQLVLIEDLDNSTFYCWYGEDFAGGPSKDPEEIMTKLVSIVCEAPFHLEMLELKRKDSPLSWCVARVHIGARHA